MFCDMWHQMFAVYVLCGAQQKDAVRLTLEQIDVVRRMCTEYQEFELVTSVQGIVHFLIIIINFISMAHF